MTKEERCAYWRRIIDSQAASGKTIAAYCRDNHIRSSCYYTWRRKLREEIPNAGGFLELTAGRSRDSSAGIRIRLGATLAVEVERGFDPFTLRAVVETLSGISRCSA